jgi:hypothetical protein
MITIPITNPTPRFSQGVDLDGVAFILAFEWNDRDETWSFNLLDSDSVPLVTGVGVRVGLPLLNRHTGIAGPAGVLEAIDTSGAGLDPGFADLGERVQLLYTPIGEIPADFRV